MNHKIKEGFPRKREATAIVDKLEDDLRASANNSMEPVDYAIIFWNYIVNKDHSFEEFSRVFYECIIRDSFQSVNKI